MPIDVISFRMFSAAGLLLLAVSPCCFDQIVKRSAFQAGCFHELINGDFFVFPLGIGFIPVGGNGNEKRPAASRPDICAVQPLPLF